MLCVKRRGTNRDFCDANNPRGAARRLPHRGAAGGRPSPCSTSYRSPTTSLQWRRRATCSTTLQDCASGGPFRQVATLAGHTGMCVGGGARRSHITGCTTTPSRCGATARASAQSRRTTTSSASRCCRAERASSAPRTSIPRCGLGGAPSALSRWAAWCLRRGAARRRALCGRPRHRHEPGPAVPRRRDARPHL